MEFEHQTRWSRGGDGVAYMECHITFGGGCVHLHAMRRALTRHRVRRLAGVSMQAMCPLRSFVIVTSTSSPARTVDREAAWTVAHSPTTHCHAVADRDSPGTAVDYFSRMDHCLLYIVDGRVRRSGFKLEMTAL